MQTIGRYQLNEKLGQGGMGVVYRAFDTLLERVVAVKVIAAQIDESPDTRERFFREARAAGQLSHKNIITIHDLGEHEGHPFLAMEYLEGEDLHQRLASPIKMSLPRKVTLAIEMCEALEYAHAHGVVHRDVKPANLFLTTRGELKILDFGLARLVTSQLTQSNMLMGTLNYMAPEQVRGERSDHRADIFSVGVVIYEMLGGRKAFEGDSFASTLYKILQDIPEPLWKIDATIPRRLASIVEHALAKPLDERYHTIGEMRQDLENYRKEVESFAGGPTISSVPAPDIRPPSGAPYWPNPGDASTMAARPASGGGVGPVTPPPAVGSSRRWLPIAAISVVAAGALAFAVWTGVHSRPKQAPVPPPAVPEVREAAGDSVARARRALEARDYAAAVQLAEAALTQTPGDAEARHIRDRARDAATAIDTGMQKARALSAAGDYQGASREAGEVLALAPSNAEARQIMTQGASESRTRTALEARARMTEAKQSARGRNAQSLAPAAFRTALQAEQEAQRLYKEGRIADATARFYDASGLFRSAALAAQTEASFPREREVPTAPQPPPAAPATPAEMEPSAATSGASRPPQPEPTAPAPPAPVAPIPRTVPPPTATVPTGDLPARSPLAEDAIRELLVHYKAALEAKNLDALRRIYPNLGGVAAEAIRKNFQQASSINVDIIDPRITVEGSTATATFRRGYELVTVDGQRLRTETLTTMAVRRSGSAWLIESIRFSPAK